MIYLLLVVALPSRYLEYIKRNLCASVNLAIGAVFSAIESAGYHCHRLLLISVEDVD